MQQRVHTKRGAKRPRTALPLQQSVGAAGRAGTGSDSRGVGARGHAPGGRDVASERRAPAAAEGEEDDDEDADADAESAAVQAQARAVASAATQLHVRLEVSPIGNSRWRGWAGSVGSV